MEACLSCFSSTTGAVAVTGPTDGAGEALAAAGGGSADAVTDGPAEAPATGATAALEAGAGDVGDGAETEGFAAGAALALA